MPLLPPTIKRFHPTIISKELTLSNTTFESLTINPAPTTRFSFSSIPHDDIINNLNQLHRHPIVNVLSSHQYAYGINILIKIGIYLTAYPPHESYRSMETIQHNQINNTRELLYLYWAQIKHVRDNNKNIFIPLNIIRYSDFRYLKYNQLILYELISGKMLHSISSIWDGILICLYYHRLLDVLFRVIQ
jgi:hypothetical protein